MNDKSILMLNDDYETYSFIIHHTYQPNRYTYGRLFEDPRISPGDFVVLGWAPIDNLVNHPEKYFTEKSQITK